MRALLALALLGPALAGCVSNGPVPAGGEPTFVLELPVHVVAVGFDGFDAAALGQHLEQPPPVFRVGRAFVTALVEREPLQYDVQYVVHEAPEAFAEELFAFAASVTEKGPPDAYLAEYDARGERRVCEAPLLPPLPPSPVRPPAPLPLPAPACGDIDRIDAWAVEQWIAGHRAAYGLEFGGASHTVFLLDSYTKGYLPRESYHQYTVGPDPGPVRDRQTDNLRAWGGSYDFVFLDVGAAPNSHDDYPWEDYVRDEDRGLTDVPDWPIWAYADDMGTFYENLGRHIVDAVGIVWANDPIYPFEYAEKYVLPTYVIIDSTALANPGNPLYGLEALDFKAHTQEAAITQVMRDLVPWAEVEQTFTYLFLPDDDPGLAAAVQDAKERYDRDYVDLGVLKKYFRENWEAYVPTTPGARIYPTFAFHFAAPSLTQYAISMSDEWGDSWGVFFNQAEKLSPCMPGPVCSHPAYDEETWWERWNVIFVHELGHSFGLWHTHDSGTLRADGSSDLHTNWLWDSTASSMTYRHSVFGFSAGEKQRVLRHHAVAFALDVLALGEQAPADARDAAERALALVRAGEDRAALEAGREAKRAAGQALQPHALDLVAGEPLTVLVEFAVGTDPVGRPPRVLPRPSGFPYPLFDAGVSWKQVPIDVPRDATAVKLEFRERPAPSHALWASYLEVYDAAGQWVTGAYDNAYGAVVLRNMARCAAGCTVWMEGESGAGMTYDVTVTPLYGEA